MKVDKNQPRGRASTRRKSSRQTEKLVRSIAVTRQRATRLPAFTNPSESGASGGWVVSPDSVTPVRQLTSFAGSDTYA